MKPSLVEHLACPACGDRLMLEATHIEETEILEGGLVCGQCRAIYPVRAGVPRFTTGTDTEHSTRTARAFGWEWKRFAAIEEHHEQQFLDWVAPASPATFAGKVVLEGGCGKGRHTRLVARYGASAVIGVDLSEAADVAFANTRDLPNAHIIQADLLNLPLRRGFCDHAFSVGVLHHLPDPGKGFASLASRVRAGGGMSVWVYGAENNAWIARFISPLRGALTSRLPPWTLYLISMVLTVPLWTILATVYRMAGRPGMAWLRRSLFYYPYLGYICKFPFHEVHHIVHDHLAAPVAHYLRRDQVEAWYRAAGAERVSLSWHNQNSWRGAGTMPGRRKEADE